jgi:hypothetical protein
MLKKTILLVAIISVGLSMFVFADDFAANNSLIIDFSFAGYAGGQEAIPDVPVKYYITPSGSEDDGKIIQYAIDQMAMLPLGPQGFRGTILLGKGVYNIPNQLIIKTSGIVLRGVGDDQAGTILKATGKGRRTLIHVSGEDDRQIFKDVKYDIQNDYVPAGSKTIALKNIDGLSLGDKIVIHVPSTKEWIQKMGMDIFRISRAHRANWQPGSRDVYFDRTVVGIDNQKITMDAPITVALDKAYHPIAIHKYLFDGRIHNVGIENLRCVSEFGPSRPKDEEHSWIAVTLESIENAWVRNLVSQYFTGSTVTIFPEGKNITIMDCQSLDPVGENGGYRRRSFFTLGQMSLFLRCYSRNGRNDFIAGHCATGPSAFVDCKSDSTSGDSGPIESWCTGAIWDNIIIDGGRLRVKNFGQKDMGVGWSGGNCVFWNCTASIIECEPTPVAANWAFGCFGELHGEGIFPIGPDLTPHNISPQSLYRHQLQKRLGANALEHILPHKINTNYSSAIAIHAKRALKQTKATDQSDDSLLIHNGFLTLGKRYLSKQNERLVWWKGNLSPGVRRVPGITRYVPGRHGLNFTDDLDELTDSFRPFSITSHHHGLWYDRRRDDHQIVRRIDADVVAPFYEYPWARSGQGTAWDRLSKYDLSKYNTWYFDRLKKFANLCDQKKQVLIHYSYFQHNILEAGAHWADFPWRPANCIQGDKLGIPEPPPYRGPNKPRIFAADYFYDTDHPLRRKLHRNYIRHCLDNFAENKNLIQANCAEFTGPLEFMQFWLDTIIEWKDETGKEVITMLEATKDVQDAILQDPKRSKHVNIISMKYWCYRPDGSLFAPEGGKNKTFREWIKIISLPGPNAYQNYRQVREYKNKYPDKAVVYSVHDNCDPWIVTMAGASAATINAPQKILESIGDMKPLDIVLNNKKEVFCLGDNSSNFLVYSLNKKSPELDFKNIPGDFKVREINTETGMYKESKKTNCINGDSIIKLDVSDKLTTSTLFWLHKL